MNEFKEVVEKLYGLGRAVKDEQIESLVLNNKSLTENETEVLILLCKISARIKSGDYILDAFFREIQNTKYEDMMYKKPYRKHEKGIVLAFKTVVYTFFKGENIDKRKELVESYSWVGREYEEMVDFIEKIAK